MRVVARRAYAPGEQVFVAYGDKSNDSLLQNYGFSEEGNPFDNFRLSALLPWLEEHQVFFFFFSEEGNPFDNFRLSALLPWLEEHQVFFGLRSIRFSFNFLFRLSVLSCLGSRGIRLSSSYLN